MSAQTYGKAGMLIVIMLATLGGFLYLLKLGSNTDGGKQEQILGSIYKMKQVDANWTADVLKAYVGLSKDYDSLGSSAKELPTSLNALVQDLKGYSVEDSKVTDTELTRLIKEKTQLIEKFKRHNSVLKNSLRYLPTVQNEIATILAQEKTADSRNQKNAEQKETVDQLVSLVLQYNLFPEDRLAASVQLQNESMRLSLGAMSPAMLEKARNLVRHVDVILSERIGLAMLVSKINEIPISDRLDSLSAEVSKNGLLQVSGNAEQQNLALIYGAIMVLLFVLVGVLTTRRIVRLKEMIRNARLRLLQMERKLQEKSQAAAA